MQWAWVVMGESAESFRGVAAVEPAPPVGGQQELPTGGHGLVLAAISASDGNAH